MPVPDILAALAAAAEAGEGPPETYLGDIQTAYDEDMSGAQAAYAELEGTAAANTAAAQAEIQRLQAHNYTLLTSGPTNDDVIAALPEDGDDTEGDTITPDDLFGEKDND